MRIGWTAARLKRLMLAHLHSVKNFSHRSQGLRDNSLGGKLRQRVDLVSPCPKDGES